MDAVGYRFRRDMASRRVAGEWYLLGTGDAFLSVADAVGVLLLDEVFAHPGATLSDLAARVAEAFDVSPEVAARDAAAFLDALVRQGILEGVPPAPRA